MRHIVLLDAGPLGYAVAPSGTKKSQADTCRGWLADLEAANVEIVIPDIADYEVRRGLIHKDITDAIVRLDELRRQYRVAPVTHEALARAADFWAVLRRAGKPTAGDKDFDADAILAGTAATIGGLDDIVVIATENLKHLGRFPGIQAQEWTTVKEFCALGD